MFAKTENLPVIGLFTSIFIAIVMGFVIGALIENLAFKDIHSGIHKLVEEELKNSNILDTSAYTRLNAKEPLIVGLTIIDQDGIIVYSDEPSLMGKTFSDNTKISKAVKEKDYYVIDRNLISQETILKGSYGRLLLLFHHSDELRLTVQVLYDLRSTAKGVLQITSLLWFTILLSVGILFIVLLSISKITSKTLEESKKDLEIEVKKRTEDLKKLSVSLDKDVKKRTEDLEYANKELTRKSIDLTEIKGQLEDKNIELESTFNDLSKQNTELIEKTMNLTELQGQLEDKNFELQQANKKILELMEARTELVNRAAHDLRTPITPILILLPTIKKRIKDRGVLYDLNVIERNASYLKRIADNLIIYLKAQTKDYNYFFKKTDIRKLIDGVLITYRESFKQHQISVRNEIPRNLHVEVDDLKITEVIQNIVSNAFKFMSKGGKVTISAKKMDNFINIRFNDTGIGMSKKTLSNLFNEFFKADESRHYEGQGLGLSICKKIIEDHHGKMWAESNGLGKGSTILFNIPINQKNKGDVT